MAEEKNSFYRGLADGAPIGIGYLAVSFAYGIMAVLMGLSPLEALLISLFNVTSAGQLAGTPIIAAGGSLIELATTQLVINSRYSLMSVSVSQKFSDRIKLRHRLYIGFGNTDEVFAVASSSREPVGPRYMLGLITLPIACWCLGTILGAVAKDILPAIVVTSLSVAMYAMFIAIVVPVARDSKPVLTCVIASVILASLFRFVPLLSGVPSGFVIIIIAVSVSALMAYLFPIGDEEEEEVSE